MVVGRPSAVNGVVRVAFSVGGSGGGPGLVPGGHQAHRVLGADLDR